MNVSISELDDQKLKSLTGRSEGHFLDFKSRRIKPAKLSETIVAFANADGGEVFVGIEEQSCGWIWDGFENEEECNAIIQVIGQIFVLGDGISCEFLRHDNSKGIVLRLDVAKSSDIKIASNGNVYVRRGAQNLIVSSAEQKERLKLNKGLRSHEDVTLQASADEIDNSISIIDFMTSVVPDAEPGPWLRKQRLIVDNLPTVAGTLLFSDEPQVHVPKAAIKVYRYRTIDQEGSRATLEFDPIAIEGNLYQQIKLAVKKVIQVAEQIPMVGIAGLERIEYPPIAIHEIITNAVIHRDYSLNDDVHVRIFDNRIEVESPGVFPAHITEKNVLSERFARNPKIVRILNKHRNPPNKDVGEGLNASFQAMRELRLKEPLITQRSNSVLVTLRHERLGSNEETIVNFLRSSDEINNSIARDLCAIGDANRMKRVFQKMMEAGIIERIEGRAQNKAAYRRGPNFPTEGGG